MGLNTLVFRNSKGETENILIYTNENKKYNKIIRLSITQKDIMKKNIYIYLWQHSRKVRKIL